MKNSRLLKVHLHTEDDVVGARQRARHIAELLGFNRLDQVRIATAVSEMARNAFRYAQHGRVEFSIEAQPHQTLVVVVSDSGPGIANLQEILGGHYRSKTGMGMGIIGTMRLMDSCDIDTGAGAGTTITLKKFIPPGAVDIDRLQLSDLASELVAAPGVDPFAEIQRQNQELMQTLAELRTRQEELLNLTRELEDTNRGVVALYAEVDEQAVDLRRANTLKTRFLSNMSHEFRTPLGSIRALAQLLLDRVDGDLGEEQEKQVKFIKKAADDLSELVNDLLDIAKIEAGKVEVVIAVFSVTELFSALRGMLLPLLQNDSVELIFEVDPDVEMLRADQAKVSHILRNFISNALKFTKQGSIRVRACRQGPDGHVSFSVSDTGIGIASEDLQLIFDEFSQIQNPLQQRHKGTGLGLPLCRQLASLLGGYIEVHSTVGEGSTFVVVLPDVIPQDNSENADSESTAIVSAEVPVLIIEEDAPTRSLYEGFLQRTRYRAFCAENLLQARIRWPHLRPKAVVLGLETDSEPTAHATVLASLNNRNNSGHIGSTSVIVVSPLPEHEDAIDGANRFYLKPLRREDLLQALDQLVDTSSIDTEQSMNNYLDTIAEGVGR